MATAFEHWLYYRGQQRVVAKLLDCQQRDHRSGLNNAVVLAFLQS
jgi:hypothetical protein